MSTNYFIKHLDVVKISVGLKLFEAKWARLETSPNNDGFTQRNLLGVFGKIFSK